MNAIILAGGFGNRLRPLTDSCPKPMLPIANRPILDYTVAQLNYYGLRDITFSLGYMPELIKKHVAKYKGIKTHFTVEEKPLGTAGGVKLAEEYLDDLFFVVCGDTVSDIDLGAMARNHLDSGAEISVAMTEVEDPRQYGVAVIDEKGIVNSFVEKPNSASFGSLVSTGIYLINKRVISKIPRDVPLDFAKDLFPSLVERRSLNAYVHEGYWKDLGSKAEYYKANFTLLDGDFYPFVETDYNNPNRIDGDNNLISATAVTVGKAKDSIIGENARIASSAVIDKCVVLPGATVTGRHKECVIGENFIEQIACFDKNRLNFYKKTDKISVHTV